MSDESAPAEGAQVPEPGAPGSVEAIAERMLQTPPTITERKPDAGQGPPPSRSLARRTDAGRAPAPSEPKTEPEAAEAPDSAEAKPETEQAELAEAKGKKKLPVPDSAPKKKAEDYIRERRERREAQQRDRSVQEQAEAKQRELEGRLAAIQQRDQRVADLRSQGKFDEALKVAGLGESLADLQREALRQRGLMNQAKDPRVEQLEARLAEFERRDQMRAEHEQQQRELAEQDTEYRRELAAVQENLRELREYEGAEAIAESHSMSVFIHNALAEGKASSLEEAAGLAHAAYRPLAEQLVKVFFPHLLASPDQGSANPEALTAQSPDRGGATPESRARKRANRNLSQSRAADASRARSQGSERDWFKRTERAMLAAQMAESRRR